MEALRPDIPLALFVLAIFSAYLVTATLVTDRISPPIFFTLAICLAVAPFRPGALVAVASIASALVANLLFALDHIHGECGYDVLGGSYSWHKTRLGGLEYYRQCSQPGLAFWLMCIIGVLWTIVLLRDLLHRYRKMDGKIELPLEEEAPASASNGRTRR